MLKGSARKYLRGLAHGLRPAVQIGKEGLTEAVLTAIDTALAASELIKVQIVAEREERHAIATTVEERLACECVGAVGHMAILYRQLAVEEKRSVRLPA